MSLTLQPFIGNRRRSSAPNHVSADERFEPPERRVLLPIHESDGHEGGGWPALRSPGWARAEAWLRQAATGGLDPVGLRALDAAGQWFVYLQQEMPGIAPGRMTQLDDGGLHVAFQRGAYDFHLSFEADGDDHYELFFGGELKAVDDLIELPRQAHLLRFIAHGNSEAKRPNPIG